MEYNQKLGPCIRQELQNSLMFPDEDHFKQCTRAKDAIFKMSTDKEPEVLCFDIKWGTYYPLDVLTVLNLIPNSIKLSEIYELEGQEECEYILKGIVIYWGAHYYSFFRVFIDGEEEWLRVDDKTITKKGAWKDIVAESVGTMVTPTIVLYEKYKEGVLVPSIRDMERKFRLDRYFLKDLIEETKKNKRMANYGDSKIDFVNRDSTPSSKNSNAEGFEEDEAVTEKREDNGEEQKGKKLKDYDMTPEKEEDKQEEPEQPQSPPIGEDDWI